MNCGLLFIFLGLTFNAQAELFQLSFLRGRIGLGIDRDRAAEHGDQLTGGLAARGRIRSGEQNDPHRRVAGQPRGHLLRRIVAEPFAYVLDNTVDSKLLFGVQAAEIELLEVAEHGRIEDAQCPVGGLSLGKAFVAQLLDQRGPAFSVVAGFFDELGPTLALGGLIAAHISQQFDFRACRRFGQFPIGMQQIQKRRKMPLGFGRICQKQMPQVGCAYKPGACLPGRP